MARASRENPPTGSGPGRGTPRSRTAARPAARAAERRRPVGRANQQPGEPEEAAADEAAPRLAARGLGLTRRALVFLVVAAVLVLSYASTLRVYFRQQSQIAATQQSIAQHQATIDSLQSQVKRWQDPAYVAAQARTRLGWVMPGEIGYQVIGADGTVLSPSVDIDAASSKTATPTTTWWQKLSGSLSTADNPSPAASATASAQPTTITATTTPTPTSSPTASSTR